MSSSGTTYFVVTYDHDSQTFKVDDDAAKVMLPHDTWDIVEERWCYLDSNLDMAEDLATLTNELKEKLNG